MTSKGQHIITYDWMLDAVGSGRECYLYALMFAMADEHGMVQMSRSYMSYRLRCVVDKIDYDLKKLQDAGHIRKATIGGNGRADATTYEVLTLEGEIYPSKKGVKNTPLKREIGGEKYPSFRGAKLPPNNNIIINNNAAEQQDAHARANDSMNTDYNFAEFWELFKPSAEHQSKRISCLNEWAHKTDEQRAMMLAILKTGKQHRDNPLFFIRYCDENYTKVVYTRDEIYKQEHTTEPVGYCILEKTDPDGLALWCRTDDAKAMGWNIRREFSA